jgi:hypothetical protein
MASEMDDQACVESNKYWASNRDGGRTICEAGVEIKRDGPVELLVDRIDEEIIFFSVGH